MWPCHHSQSLECQREAEEGQAAPNLVLILVCGQLHVQLQKSHLPTLFLQLLNKGFGLADT